MIALVSLIIIFISPARILFSETFLGSIDNFIYQIFKKDRIPNFYFADTQPECIKIGGKWQKLGMRQKEGCQIYSNDGDKLCFAGFQCQLGICETSLKSPLALGKCSWVLRRCGCSTQIHFGITGMSLCID